MTECEVCSGPDDGTLLVTLAAPGTKPVKVRFCQACTDALFSMMSERWNAGVAAHKAEVDQMVKLMGMPSIDELLRDREENDG